MLRVVKSMMTMYEEYVPSEDQRETEKNEITQNKHRPRLQSLNRSKHEPETSIGIFSTVIINVLSFFNFCFNGYFLAHKVPIGNAVNSVSKRDEKEVSNNKMHSKNLNDDLDAWLNDAEDIGDNTSLFFSLL